jgi:hypothetical protein
MISFHPCDYWEWIDEIKLSPTPSPELDEEYEVRRDNENIDRTACMRHCEEDLIWRNHLQNEEWNLNQRARQLDIREAHLCRREHICDRREADLRSARLWGRGRGRIRVH